MADPSSASNLERALDAYARGFQRWLPSPFTIAVMLTVVAALMALRQASAPEVLVQQVVARLQALGGRSVEELSGRAEHIVFSLPPALRRAVAQRAER